MYQNWGVRVTDKGIKFLFLFCVSGLLCCDMGGVLRHEKELIDGVLVLGLK